MHRYYYGLDGLRFFSALAVCIFHLAFYVWATDYADMARIFADRAKFEELMPFAWSGWVGVQIFFVISGFVIAHSANGATPMAFLRSRMLRLFPAAWVCAIITLVVRLMVGDAFGEIDGDFLRSIVLWPKGPWIVGVYWSLAIEVMFYLLVFGVLLSRNFKRLPWLAWALAAVSTGFILLSILKRAHLGAQGEWFKLIEEQAEFLPIRHGVFFALGIWLWMLSNRSLPKSGWLGMAIAVVAGVAEIGLRGFDLRGPEAPPAAGQPLLTPMLIWLVAIGALVAFTRWPERFVPRSQAGVDLLKLSGKVTYPLYLVHGIVGAAFLGWLIDLGIQPYAALLIGMAFVLALAALVAVYAEPLMRKPLRTALDVTEAAAARMKRLGFLFKRAEAIPTGGAG
jgi:exopolysaccharide production protein ExoZ